MRDFIKLVCLLSSALLMSACEINGLGGDGGLFGDFTGDGGVIDNAQSCTDVCSKVQACDNANPPAVQFFGSEGSSGVDGLDCAANCISPDSARYGYSSCQQKCIKGVSCAQINDCWKTSSDSYKKYCLAGRTVPPVVDTETQPAPDNNTTTGSEVADDLTEDPGLADAILDSDLPINVGNEPPVIFGLYKAIGTIDESSNARPVGAPINTQICFWGQETLVSGTAVSYCEYNVPGVASAPVTGDPENFTIYLTFEGMATILFSGQIESSGDVKEAEALVTYSYGMGIWEHSVTQWERLGDCGGCP
ncbi:hypothetical protein KKF91_02095 [Myxococcota bacterium]|nr:hypothetical protein [Myxococcota bacterium]MBU1429329.1 hypothetical protein [Myxococcota bacterium]MBU1896595.1 hypothetical protein [Myxococcota bacterium]